MDDKRTLEIMDEISTINERIDHHNKRIDCFQKRIDILRDFKREQIAKKNQLLKELAGQ